MFKFSDSLELTGPGLCGPWIPDFDLKFESKMALVLNPNDLKWLQMTLNIQNEQVFENSLKIPWCFIQIQNGRFMKIQVNKPL